ncbi:MAG TPA: TadE/TadG family type IV pilus assembly protein [Anaerolineales bacterium]|nr:TadE/TadG family type IV pilus assembly protein [Anaerolineales bacterium]
MKLTKFLPRKNFAQAMVEFAIVLPILLLLLYGLLETGRLLFIYSTIVTASRQAVRYGAATGNGDGGVPGNDAGIPRYQDCAGIRAAANRVDYLNAFNHNSDDIMIFWDNGPTTGMNPMCPVGSATDTSFTPSGATDRMIVTVIGHFNPIVPKIVPFGARTITANSARTILFSVPIEVPAPPGGPPGGPSASLTLSVTAAPLIYDTLGQTITYTYTVTNGSVAVSGLSINDDKVGSITCIDTTLAANASTTCTGTYKIVSGDMNPNPGSVTNTATATASDGTNSVTSNTATATITLAQPKLDFTKTVDPPYGTEGDTVTYTFTVTNTGNVPLTAAAVTDPKLGGPQSGCGGDLAVGATRACTATYKLASSDIATTTMVNNASASAQYVGSTTKTVNATSSASLYTGSLYLSVTASPGSVNKAGQVITYTYTITNNTKNIKLTAPYNLTSSLGASCSFPTGDLNAGKNKSCTGSYTVTQTDINSGKDLKNTATASAKGTNTVTSNTFSVTVSVVTTPGLTLTINPQDVTPNPATALNTVITYIYTLTNTGNVTLTAPKITDMLVINITCPASIAPGATGTCTGTHSVTQADIEAGSITNTATATATFNSKTITSNSQSFTVSTYLGPRLKLQITPNPNTFTTADQMIGLTYDLTNTGSEPLSAIAISDPDGKVTIDCSSVAGKTLATGSKATCVGIYTTTAGDMSVGYVGFTATATGTGTTGSASSNAITMISVPGAPPLAACSTVATGATINKTDNIMSMTINNPLNLPLMVKDVTVQWNHDSGHTGPDTTLKLQDAALDSTLFWAWIGGGSGSGYLAPNITITPSTALYIPANSNPTISFTFQQSYDNWDNPASEYVAITLDMPCAGTVISLHR